MPDAVRQDAAEQKSGTNRVQAYAKLEFDKFSFFVQTLQVTMGRKASNSSDCDVHLGDTKAISRQHAKIAYSFPNQRFELSVIGKNGAFVDGEFVERGSTVPLHSGTRVQIGQISFSFLLPEGLQKQEQRKSEAAAPGSHRMNTTVAPVIEPKPSIDQNQDSLYTSVKEEVELDSTKLSPPPLMTTEPAPANLFEHPGAIDPHPLESLSFSSEYKPQTVSPQFIQRQSSNAFSSVPSANPETLRNLSETPPTSSIPTKHGSVDQESNHPSTSLPLHPGLESSQPQNYGDIYQKPNLSYANLIARTLIANSNKKLTLGDICEWISNTWPYYRYQPPAWHNSIRHNLSLNKAFIRIPRRQNESGKGSFWILDPSYIDQFEGNMFRKTKKPASTPTGAASFEHENIEPYRSDGTAGGKISSSKTSDSSQRASIAKDNGSATKEEKPSLLQSGIQPIIMLNGKLALNPEFFRNSNGEQQAPNEQAVHAISLLQDHINRQLGPAAVNNPAQATAIANALAVALAKKLQKQQLPTPTAPQQDMSQQTKRRKASVSATVNQNASSTASSSSIQPNTSFFHIPTPPPSTVTSVPPPYVRPPVHSQSKDSPYGRTIEDPLPPGAVTASTATANLTTTLPGSSGQTGIVPNTSVLTSDRPLYVASHESSGEKRPSFTMSSYTAYSPSRGAQESSFHTTPSLHSEHGGESEGGGSESHQDAMHSTGDVLRGVKRQFDEAPSSFT
ncbi:fork head transcription factor Fhl1 [Schizosaccharomyces cryophilus OY26]|uniref:Fork head transcription factor Fhl1 n=1 Tax=Schizosaccharomyces cryophilus (strain OY26 / ATCC MYA-4695 / CBS 11777 / NBRC 106824 / NRRL Y48691) TaxID=653667 RepID=S9XH33_SCHCR|nr:fork head transcription factor Fhl1 [Schizosaccharomyces cryophilus OY26]EPY52981.1 fork head transcription factor Fhl1 [Schizosaccharomyces cryophilus OY26]